MIVYADQTRADQCLRAIAAYSLLLSLSFQIKAFNEELIEIPQPWGVPLFLALIMVPLGIYDIFRKYPIFINRYSPATFEWSYYASLMGVLTIQVCLVIGISHGMLPLLLLSNTICLILPMLAVNLRKEKSLVNYRFKTSWTYLDIAIVTVFFLASFLIIYYFPFDFYDSFSEDCPTKWLCAPLKPEKDLMGLKGFLASNTFLTRSTLYQSLQLWKAREMVMELSNEETGEVKQTILERRGWKWVVKGEEKLKIQ